MKNRFKIWVLTKRINRLRQTGAVNTYHKNPEDFHRGLEEMVRMGLSEKQNHKLVLLKSQRETLINESIECITSN